MRLRLSPAYLLLLPTALFLCLFFVVPLSQVIALAFQSHSGSWSLDSIRRMVTDFYFVKAVRDTLLLTIIIVPIQLALAFGAALIVNRRLRGSSVLLYLLVIPLGISDLTSGLIWLSIFTQHGYLNTMLADLGWIARPVIFLSYQSPQWLLGAVVVSEVWRATPLVMLILLSGLQMVARDYLEAADSFGATSWQKLRYVIFPLIKPSIQTALIIRTMLALQVFGPIIVLTGRLLPVMASESYTWYTLIRDPNVAAAYAVLLMLISAAVTWVYLRVLRTGEEQIGVM